MLQRHSGFFVVSECHPIAWKLKEIPSFLAVFGESEKSDTDTGAI
jgi:hypothetical protein